MQFETNTIRRAFGAILFSGALVLAAGCHSQSVSAGGPDPALANMAQANGQVLGQNASYAPQLQGEQYPQQGYPQQAPAPIEQNYPQQAYPQQSYPQQPGYQPTPDEQAGEEALEETTQAPPELPEYDQPPTPGPDYIWTPGYWAWGPYGYYWVPGAWVEAPYYGALWTPPYWGWYNGYYRFHPGYWGLHVGYYGGINYGFGYIGIGYFGGYWSGNSFYYNRAVTRVGPVIRNVYERPVIYNNVRYGAQPISRVSYNGGRGGINVQPRPAEITAMRERHDAPLAAQHQARVEASQNRAQSFAVNRGRPSEAFAQQGFANTRGIAPAPRGIESNRPVPEGRPAQPNTSYANERAANPSHEQPNGNSRFENRPQPQPNTANPRFENRAQPQPRVEAPPRVENRPAQPQPNAAQPRFENRPQPQPRVENQPQPQPRMEAPRQENRPMPQPQQHMEAPRQAPPPRPQGPPPQAHTAPPPHGGNGGGGHQGGGGGHQGGDEHGHR